MCDEEAAPPAMWVMQTQPFRQEDTMADEPAAPTHARIWRSICRRQHSNPTFMRSRSLAAISAAHRIVSASRRCALTRYTWWPKRSWPTLLLRRNARPAGHGAQASARASRAAGGAVGRRGRDLSRDGAGTAQPHGDHSYGAGVREEPAQGSSAERSSRARAARTATSCCRRSSCGAPLATGASWPLAVSWT